MKLADKQIEREAANALLNLSNNERKSSNSSSNQEGLTKTSKVKKKDSNTQVEGATKKTKKSRSIHDKSYSSNDGS